jgi:xanthine dehydrogenase YagR molybdenum-binding subunit
MPQQAQPSPSPRPKKKIRVPRVVNGVEQMVEIEVDEEAGPGWGPNDKHRLLNQRITRVDGPVKATGVARYTYDQRLPGMLYGRILRCPHGHARVTKMDTAAALQMPGVKAIVQGPLTELRFAGAPVAAVAATTPEIAGDALRAIKVTYEVLPHVVHAPDAIKPGAPKILADPNEANLQEKAKNGDLKKVEAAFATADEIVEAEYTSARIHHACLETHGMVVDYRGGNSATVYASTQWTFSIPGDAAKELGLQQSDVTSSVEHMGGGFGSKFGIGVEGMFACRLSKQTKAPVKMMLTRYDEFVMAGNRSAAWQKLKAGVKKDGTIVALQARQYRLGGIGQGSQAGQPFIYSMGDTYREIYALHTNEDSSVAMRAPGYPQASFAAESLVDELAHKIGMDPVEFRKKNLRDQVYHRQLDRGAREIGWSRRNRVAGGNPGPLKRGMGCAVGVWGGAGNNQCKVDVTT